MTKLKTAFWLAVAICAVIVLGPQLAKFSDSPKRPTPGPIPRYTLEYGHSMFQFPHKAPDADSLSHAEWDETKAVLYVSWPGPRIFRISWFDGVTRTSSNPHKADPVHPFPGKDGLTVFAVILDKIKPGAQIGINGDPHPPDLKGLAVCEIVYHVNKVAENSTQSGGVGCTFVIPPKVK